MNYLILSGPRTGSTMLAEALNSTGRAGRVEEYFHSQKLLEAGSPEETKQTLISYFRYLVLANATQGVFGMKIHFNQYENVFKRSDIDEQGRYNFLASFDKHILIYRRDKVLQAISEMLSSETGLWNSSDAKATGLSKRTFRESDVPVISRIMARQIAEEYGWRRLLQRFSIGFHQVSYEELTIDPEAELRKVTNYLGIGDLCLARPTTVKVSDTRSNIAIKEAFLSAIGATSAAVS